MIDNVELTSRSDIVTRDRMEWQLGVIERADIDIERSLTFWLAFKFHGCGQSFGGFALDEWSERDRRRVGHAAGSDALIGIMTALGVEKWSQLHGKLAWAIRASSRGTIVGIAPPAALVEGDDRVWLVSDWRKRWFPEVAR